MRRWLGPAALAAVVKADGYAMGGVEIARAALAAGAERLAVARVHEAVDLRQQGIAAPILVLSRTDPSEAVTAAHYGLTVTVDSLGLISALEEAAQRTGREVAVQLKVDTGLHRFGVEPERALPLARALSDANGLRVEAIWTHFASADASDLRTTEEQFRLFGRIVAQLESSGYQFQMRHAANSAATIAYRESHLDMVRVGLSLYGISPILPSPEMPLLLPAVSFKVRIARVMSVNSGETVGYGETWRATRPTRVALLTAGYADGVPRTLSNRGHVVIGGASAQILGRVSMDHTVVDVTDVASAGAGSIATLFGDCENGQAVDIWETAGEAETIPHEILTGVGPRVPRLYLRGGEVVRAARPVGSLDLRLGLGEAYPASGGLF